MPARAWGVEHLSPLDRVEMVLEAGYDQSGGGEACTELVVELVRAGRVGEDRIDVPFDTADPLFGWAKGLASAASPLVIDGPATGGDGRHAVTRARGRSLPDPRVRGWS